MNHEVPTMLHLSAKLGLCEIVNRLLDLPSAADVCTLRNSNGHTPADLARQNGHEELADFLEEYCQTVSVNQNSVRKYNTVLHLIITRYSLYSR